MPRFFLPPEAFCSGCLDLTGEHAAHARVLRLKPGDSVLLCDGAGMEYPATVTAVSADRIALSAGPAVPSTAEPTLQASIFMAFPKADKLEHVIQKATELGAREIVAFPSARCVSRPIRKAFPKNSRAGKRLPLPPQSRAVADPFRKYLPPPLLKKPWAWLRRRIWHFFSTKANTRPPSEVL